MSKEKEDARLTQMARTLLHSKVDSHGNLSPHGTDKPYIAWMTEDQIKAALKGATMFLQPK